MFIYIYIYIYIYQCCVNNYWTVHQGLLIGLPPSFPIPISFSRHSPTSSMQSATTYDIYQSQTEATSRVVPSPRYSQPCQPVVTISWWIIHSLLLLCLPLFSVLRKHKILRLFPSLSCLRAPYKATRIFAQRKINIRNFLFTNLAHATILSLFFLISRFISLFFSPSHLSRGMKYADARDNFWVTDDPRAFSSNLNRGELPNLYTPT